MRPLSLGCELGFADSQGRARALKSGPRRSAQGASTLGQPRKLDAVAAAEAWAACLLGQGHRGQIEARRLSRGSSRREGAQVQPMEVGSAWAVEGGLRGARALKPSPWRSVSAWDVEGGLRLGAEFERSVSRRSAS